MSILSWWEMFFTVVSTLMQIVNYLLRSKAFYNKTMRSLPGDLFNCMSCIILSRVFLSILYLVRIMFSQYVLSNIPNHFALLLNLVSLCQIFCQNDWTSSLVGSFSNLILLPLKSLYAPFGVLKNLRLIDFLSFLCFQFLASRF